MYSKKKTTIIVMMVAVFVMVVGYAAFSANLIISGTANVASNWNVYISNVETKTIYGKAENASGSPTYSNLSARMKVNLKEPGDYIVYEVTITNGGTLNAIIDNIKATNLGTSAIIHTVEGINKGEPIANGATKKFTVTIEYDPTVTSQPETLDNTLILDINCVQDLNQNIPGGDIDVNAPEIITLSGNNNLTLNSAFPTNLANYKITGNSVQNKLPDEYQEVEYIEGTGTQYIEIDYIASGMTNSKGKFQITNIEKGGFLFGSRESSNSKFYGFNWGGGLPYKYYNAYVLGAITTVNIDNQVHTFSKQKGKLYVDGTLLHTATDDSFVTPGKMNIFASYNGGTTGYLPSVVKLFYLQFYDNGKLSVNLIPCYRKSDNVIGLYDSVNNVFYANKGTGTFVKGANVVESKPTPDVPIEVQSVGEKTKNLLDVFGRTPGTCGDGVNTAVRNFEFDKYYVGLTMNNYCYPTSVTYHEITNESVIINPKYGGYGIGYPYKVKSNTKYSISWGEGGNIGIGFYTSGGEYISHVTNGSSFSFTTPENCEVITVVLRPDTGKNTTYKSVQLEESTTPTSYEPYGYKIPVKVNGKNLFNINNVVSSSNVKNNNDGTLSVTPQASSSGVSATAPKTLRDYAPNMEVGKTYVLSANTTGTGNRIYLNITKRAWQFGKSLTITEDDLNSNVVWYANGTDTTFTATISNIQIEEGTVATEYEPYYIESSTTNIYLDEPLRCISGYCDYIDFANGKVVRNIKGTVLTGTETWSLHSGGYSFVVSISDSIKKYKSSLCSHFKNVNYAWDPTYNGKFDMYSDHDGVLNKYFRQPNSNVTTVAGFKQWLESEIAQGTPVKLIYTLASPVEQTIKLPQIYIPQGNVKLSISSNGLDIPIEVSYYKK